MNKWVMVGVMSLGLFAFGYMVYVGQRSEAPRISRGPIAVGAVRGGAEPISDSSSAGSNQVNYTSVLKDNLDMAQNAVDKYQAGSNSRMEQVNKTADANK